MSDWPYVLIPIAAAALGYALGTLVGRLLSLLGL